MTTPRETCGGAKTDRDFSPIGRTRNVSRGALTPPRRRRARARHARRHRRLRAANARSISRRDRAGRSGRGDEARAATAGARHVALSDGFLIAGSFD
eukprot:29086-Pelagococcus_subviridis.AAC.1